MRETWHKRILSPLIASLEPPKYQEIYLASQPAPKVGRGNTHCVCKQSVALQALAGVSTVDYIQYASSLPAFSSPIAKAFLTKYQPTYVYSWFQVDQ